MSSSTQSFMNKNETLFLNQENTTIAAIIETTTTNLTTTTTIMDDSKNNVTFAPTMAPTTTGQQKEKDSSSSFYNFFCAPWIPPERRKIAFKNIDTWDIFHYNNNSRRAGEDYMTASLDYALRQNGFQVDYIDGDVPGPARSSYHRMIEGGPSWGFASSLPPELACRMRFIWYFGNWNEDKRISPQQILSAYPESYNTFIGFFIHSIILDFEKQGYYPPKQRDKHGLIFGKGPGEFSTDWVIAFVDAVIREGFTIHSTFCPPRLDQLPRPDQNDLEPNIKSDRIKAIEYCTKLSKNGTEPNFIGHGKLDPPSFERLVRQMSFVLGQNNAPIQPTPLIALANGAAFLNPIGQQGHNNSVEYASPLHEYPLEPPLVRPRGKQDFYVFQHDPLAFVGFPYVYNIVDKNNTTEIVRMTRLAHKHRFASYVPWEFHPQSMIRRVCSALLENDALCDCPNRVFGQDQQKNRATDEDDRTIDCHASSYIKQRK